MNAEPRPPPPRPEALSFLTRLAMSPRFHRLAARIPGLRWKARIEGAALFSVLSGFVQSQALVALVEGRLLHVLAAGPMTAEDLSRRCAIPPAPLLVLLRAGAALKLLRGDRKGRWHLAPRGAAFLTVPGLEPMVRHHHVLYRDLADPLAFFRGQTETELAGFWPYVFGTLAQEDAGLAARYSRLMAESQVLVAEDTLRLVDLSRQRHLLDVGGGTGAFLAEVGRVHPALKLSLFDMPAVLAGVPAALRDRLSLNPGSFRSDPSPHFWPRSMRPCRPVAWSWCPSQCPVATRLTLQQMCTLPFTRLRCGQDGPGLWQRLATCCVQQVSTKCGSIGVIGPM